MKSGGRCSCIKWENNFDCSSRQTHFWLFLLMKGCVVENNKKKTTTTWWKKMMTTCLFIYLWRTKKNDENDYQQFYSFVYYVWMRNHHHHHHHHYNHYSTLIIFKRVPSAMQIFCVAKHLLISFSNLCFLFFFSCIYNMMQDGICLDYATSFASWTDG